MKPYYQDGAVTIYHADCRDILPLLEPVDLVLTSPPYNLGNAVKGSFYGGKGKGAKIEYLSHDDNMEASTYRIWQRQAVADLYAHLRDPGVLIYIHKPRVVDGQLDDRKNLISVPIRQEIIWDRCGMVNFSGGFFAPSTERLFLIATPSWKPNKEYLGLGEVWRFPPDTDTPHPAPFPLNLARQAIAACSPSMSIVLDPFMGSGTTLRAAKDLGRKAIGIEIEERYCEIAAKRMAQTVMPL
tara:strand:+ start:2852 stop:3574 length:723 start_codon:yes stop_codon:yes gene_type:complete